MASPSLKPPINTCYFDGMPCDCGAFDVLHDGCPRDEYAHEEDQDYSDADLDLAIPFEVEDEE